MDGETAKQFQRLMAKQGMDFHLGQKVSGVTLKPEGSNSAGATVEFAPAAGGDAQTLDAEVVLVAIGRRPNTEGLGCEEAGVAMERGRVTVDAHFATNVPGIYAIGDVAGPPMLAHKAEHEGVICVETIKGLHTHALDRAMIPGCTYCQPQIASVGLTEAKAKEAGHEIRVGRFPFIGNGKAIALGEPEGMVKTIFDAKTGQLLGAHMVGAEVTELIQGFVVAMNCETTEEELINTVFPHPTLSETMHESVLDAYGRVIHS
jgi:dihydrolipoamide dehydrogenase